MTRTPPTPGPPTPRGFSRGGARIQLVVVHSDPRPPAEMLSAFAGPGGRRAPHYYVDARGDVTAFVPEARAARCSGIALWENRRRDIDRVSVAILAEHTPGTDFAPGQLTALHVLTEAILRRYRLDARALRRWLPGPGPGRTDGVLLSLELPPEPLVAPLDLYGPPGPLADYPGASGPAVLGGEEAAATQALWLALQQETFRWRGEGLKDWAFHRYADDNGLGAPLARSAGPPLYVACDGKQYGFQPYATDVIFNEIPKWREVQSLHALLGGTIPPAGLGRLLLEAAYRATGTALFAGQAFPQRAVHDRLSVALGAGYRATLAGQLCAVQVFGADVLYTPIASPESATNWGDVRRLSQTPAGPLYDALWAEACKPAGANPAGRFAAFAAQARDLGVPLSDVYQITVGGVRYDVQVFTRDTLFAGPDGTVGRKNQLPHDNTQIGAGQPPPPPPPPPPSGPDGGVVGRGVLPPSGVDSAWLAAHPNAPDKVKTLLAQALCLLGYEDTIFDALPPNLRAIPYGAVASDPINRKDICCADLVTLILTAAGLDCTWVGPGGTTNKRLADYYTPCPSNTKLRELGPGEPPLPGDIYVYNYYGGSRADHVNMYVGELTGTLPALGVRYAPNDGNVLVEASINRPNIPARIYQYIRPCGLAWYQSHTAWIRRGRLRELEAAYRAAGMV